MRIFMQNICNNQNWLEIKILQTLFYENSCDMHKQSVVYTALQRYILLHSVKKYYLISIIISNITYVCNFYYT